MRKAGVRVDTFSVRAPPPTELHSAVDRADAAETFTILSQPLWAFPLAALAAVVSRPGAFFSSLMVALRLRPPGLRAFLLSLAHFAEALVLARELRRRGIERLHNHFANSGATVGLLAARLIGIRWSFTIHGISEFDYPAGLTLPAKIAAAEFVACVSWFGKAQAMRMVPTDQWSKLTVVRCGLDLTQLPVPNPHGSGKPTIICVGRLSPEKGHGGLFEALAMFAPDERPNLVLVGDGPQRAELETLVDHHGLGGSVTFAGRKPEAETLEMIAASDILVLPSFMEGLPIVLMEAMALGVGVIASRVAGIPELVVDGHNGLLFTPARWDELHAAMARLVRDANLRANLAAAARRAVAEEFDITISAKKLAALFQSAGALQ